VAEWGTKIVGLSIPVKSEDELTAGKVYQADFSTPIDIPDALEAPLITELCKLRDKVAGSETTYVYVSGRAVTVQWKQVTASPISAGAVVVALLALAIIVLAVALALVSLSRVEGVPATSYIWIFVVGAVIVVIILVFVMPRLKKKG